MAARAYWKGQIRLALVSIPVEIFSATKSGATIAFNQIHEPTGKRIKYEKVVPGIGPVDPDEIVKGYQYEKGSYVLLDDEEIEAVKLESKKTLELTQFVDYDDIDVLYYEKPYFVVPADDLAEEAFIVLREALRRTKKVGARPARDARPRISGQPQALRARHRARDAALRRRGQQGAGLFPRHRRCQARRGAARPRRGADRPQDRQVRSRQVPRPLYRGARGADRAQAQGQDDPHRRGRGKPAAAPTSST